MRLDAANVLGEVRPNALDRAPFQAVGPVGHDVFPRRVETVSHRTARRLRPEGRKAAHLYRLALEKGSAGARYHAVAEEGVPLREIAEAIGRGLKVPVVSKSAEEASENFGWLGFLVGHDVTASGALTQERLGWRPTGPGLIDDLNATRYFEPAAETADLHS